MRWRSRSKKESGTTSYRKYESAALFADSSAFQPVSVGLGFRVIPTLGGGAQQFEPYGFRFPSRIAGFAFCRAQTVRS